MFSLNSYDQAPLVLGLGGCSVPHGIFGLLRESALAANNRSYLPRKRRKRCGMIVVFSSYLVFSAASGVLMLTTRRGL